MRCKTLLPLLLIICCIMFAGGALADDLSDNYYQTIGDYFGVSYESVLSTVDDLGMTNAAVAFHIASRCKVSLKEIINKRSKDLPWHEVAGDCGLSATTFYVMVSGCVNNRTYGPAIEKFSNSKESQFSEVILTDRQIIDLVILKMMYSHYDFSACEIMAMRDVGSSWVRVNQKVISAKMDLLTKVAAR